ncbi:MAG: hypothetical protein MJA30_23965, partial [Cytophagales bacterium]|nr:hypothetical protein [Cytophagales bacterium]
RTKAMNMESTMVNNLLDKALREYDMVMEELNRPQEDLVMIAACELIKESIKDFLTAYLVGKGVLDLPKGDVLALQEECAKIDPVFENLNLNTIPYLKKDTDNMTFMHITAGGQLQKHIQKLEITKELVVSSL